MYIISKHDTYSYMNCGTSHFLTIFLNECVHTAFVTTCCEDNSDGIYDILIIVPIEFAIISPCAMIVMYVQCEMSFMNIVIHLVFE